MESFEKNHLKLVYFMKWKMFCQQKRLKKLKTSVALNLKTIVIPRQLRKQQSFFGAFKTQLAKKQEMMRLCKEATKNRHTLKSFLELSSLNATTTKLIYVIHYDRIKTLRKFFAIFFNHRKNSEIN